jgi:hypothetical protein
MEQGEVNELIQQKVENIDDSKRRRFIRELLKFEQSKIDKDQPRYKKELKDLIEEYSANTQ